VLRLGVLAPRLVPRQTDLVTRLGDPTWWLSDPT